MMKTKAAFLQNLKEPLVIQDNIEIPPLREGQVLVEIKYSGICQSQIMEADGYRGENKYLPHMLGHEGSGIVLEVGSQVTKVRPGDSVVMTWIKSEGKENTGTQYKWNEKIINAGFITTFMNHAVVSENRLVKVPENIPMDIATLFGCAVPTGAGIILNQVQAKPSDTIVIWGLGGIGLSALMGTRAKKFSKVIAVDIEDKKLELAKSIGAEFVVNASKEDPVAKVLALTGGLGVDFAVESAGHTQTIESAFAVVRKKGGRCIFASHPKHGEKICLDPHHLISGKHIEGSWGGETQPDRDVPIFADLYNKKILPLDSMLKDRYSFEDINKAMADLKNRKVNRALIEM